MQMKTWLLRIFGFAGTALFGALLIVTWATPGRVERAAKDFITAEVRKQVEINIDGLDVPGKDDALARVAGALQKQNALIARAAKAELSKAVDARFDEALALIRNPDCACRSMLAIVLAKDRQQANSLAVLSAPRLTQFIQMKYLGVVAELERDLRIFSATNALACLLLLVLSFARPRAMAHLAVPAVLLATAVVVCSYFYAFQQNWFYTVVYGDYWGFAYLAFLGIIFGLLLDIFLNRGKVVTLLGNAALSAVGSVISLSPC